jgi:AmpE protein
MVIESAGGDSSADDVDDFGDVAASFFSVMALQRWFGPVIYFLLLGPVGAVAYRLAHLTHETKTPLSDSLMRMLEWLPSRLLVLSFSVFGDFDKSIERLTGKGMTLDVDTGDFLEDATDAAISLPVDASVYDRLSAVFHLLERGFLLWLGAVALLVLI